MKQHIAKVAVMCFYHLRCLRQICRHVGSKVATRLVLALIMSRLDYCNSMLASLSLVMIAPLQCVQNAAARLIFELGTREHVTASLLQLHWLPVRWWVQFKLCCLMHSVFYGKCPDYLINVAVPSTAVAHITIFVIVRVVSAAATHQVWRLCLHVCRPICMELTTEGLTCCH